MIKTANQLRTLFRFTFFLLFFGAISAQTIQIPTGKTIDSKLIDAFLEKEMKSTKTPGLSIAIINNSEIAYHATKGLSRPGKKTTDKTLFEAASLSKPLFGYYVMHFVGQGLLDLDKPLYTYLPYQDIVYDERYKKITARMVLSHRTGFPNWRPDGPNSTLKIDFEPGSKFQYSGEGYQYLALVLQKILKTDVVGLQKHFEKQIAKPLGLKVTRYVSNKKNQRNKARAFKNGEWKALKDQGDKEFGAAYGINTNAKDFATWIIALMNKKRLSKESYQELFKDQTILPEDNPNRASGVSSLTLGFYAGNLPFGRIYGHGGNNDKEFTCMFYFIPEMKWGTVLFTNSSHGEEIGLRLFQYLLSIQ